MPDKTEKTFKKLVKKLASIDSIYIDAPAQDTEDGLKINVSNFDIEFTYKYKVTSHDHNNEDHLYPGDVSASYHDFEILSVEVFKGDYMIVFDSKKLDIIKSFISSKIEL